MGPRRPKSRKLSTRETQIVILMGFGYTDKQIGEALFISPHTAHTHIGNILKKLGAHNKAHAVGVFYRVGTETLRADNKEVM
jgi:DNA-binding CsgD family transcriptional regulator